MVPDELGRRAPHGLDVARPAVGVLPREPISIGARRAGKARREALGDRRPGERAHVVGQHAVEHAHVVELALLRVRDDLVRLGVAPLRVRQRVARVRRGLEGRPAARDGPQAQPDDLPRGGDALVRAPAPRVGARVAAAHEARLLQRLEELPFDGIDVDLGLLLGREAPVGAAVVGDPERHVARLVLRQVHGLLGLAPPLLRPLRLARGERRGERRRVALQGVERDGEQLLRVEGPQLLGQGLGVGGVDVHGLVLWLLWAGVHRCAC